MGQADVRAVVVTHLRHVVGGRFAINGRGRTHFHNQRTGADDVVVTCRHVSRGQRVVACGQADGAGQSASVRAHTVAHAATGAHAGAGDAGHSRDVAHRLPAHKTAEGGATVAGDVGQADKLGIVIDHRRQGLGRDGGAAGVVVVEGVAQLG